MYSQYIKDAGVNDKTAKGVKKNVIKRDIDYSHYKEVLI